MHRPYADELTQLDLVLHISIPEADGEHSRIVCEHDSDTSLGCFVRLARFGLVVEIHYATHEG